MNERDGSTGKTDEEMRPLPDGGLSESLPEWLRRPPAWRNLPRKEDPAGAPPDQTQTLPEPDTSVIDPRELITVEDLPQWLQDIAAREAGPMSDAGERKEPVEESTSEERDLSIRSSAQPEVADLQASPSSATAPSTTQPWIWALRATVILTILAIIFYVFIL